MELLTGAVPRSRVLAEVRAAPPLVDCPGERTVLAALAHVVLMYAVKRGLDPEDLCGTGGFRASDLADRDRQVPYTWLVALSRAVERRVPGVSVELEVARYAVVEQFGYLGQVVKHAATPLAALRAVVRHARLLDSAFVVQRVELECDASEVRLMFPALRSQARGGVATLLAGSVALLRAIGTAGVTPREVRVPSGAPRLDPALVDYLGGVVTTEGADYRLVFDRAELERPSVHAEEGAAKYFGAQVEKLIDQLDQPFVVLVTRAIAAQLNGDLSQRRIGRHLALSPRSLQRKLHQHGLKYTTLVEDTRKAVAARLLLDPGRSISDVANELGYRDASSFTRVFKRWTGLNPRRYRDRQRALIAS